MVSWTKKYVTYQVQDSFPDEHLTNTTFTNTTFKEILASSSSNYGAWHFSEIIQTLQTTVYLSTVVFHVYSSHETHEGKDTQPVI